MEMEYNFGTIKQGDVVNRDFDFTNIGKEPIIISEAHGSCGCTVPQWPKEPVAKGAEINNQGYLQLSRKDGHAGQNCYH